MRKQCLHHKQLPKNNWLQQVLAYAVASVEPTSNEYYVTARPQITHWLIISMPRRAANSYKVITLASGV